MTLTITNQYNTRYYTDFIITDVIEYLKFKTE